MSFSETLLTIFCMEPEEIRRRPDDVAHTACVKLNTGKFRFFALKTRLHRNTRIQHLKDEYVQIVQLFVYLEGTSTDIKIANLVNGTVSFL